VATKHYVRGFALKLGALLATLLLLGCVHAFAQRPSGTSALEATGGVQGALTVTATVVTSVGVVIGPDGEPRMVVANAVDPRDNVSNLEPVVMARKKPELPGHAKIEEREPFCAGIHGEHMAKCIHLPARSRTSGIFENSK
jgi:hypothetical protein